MSGEIERLIEGAPQWRNELSALREIALAMGLQEAIKWKQPCFTLDGGNVAILNALRDYCALSFFKGALLVDPDRLLDAPGRHSQATRQLRFTSVEQIRAMEAPIREMLSQAMEIERQGRMIDFKASRELTLPAELTAALEEDAELSDAFGALTPGRQRGWVLHFSGAKQASTRISRIAKARDAILAGKGFNDR